MILFRLLCFLLFPTLLFNNLARGLDLPMSNATENGAGISISGGDGEPVEAMVSAGSNGTPGVSLRPDGKAWDFSAHSRIEAVIANTGDHPLPVSLRVDNAGHWKNSPWSSETIRLNPGDTKTLVVFFGYSYGMKPAFALDPAAVTQLLFFTTGSKEARSFSILSVTATGAPGETPDQWNRRSGTVPEGGVLFDLTTQIQSARQLSSQQGASITADTPGLQLRFPGNGGAATFHSVSGGWDLRHSNHVEVAVTNDGSVPIRPGGRVNSGSGSTATVWGEPIPGGETSILVIPFASPEPWKASLEQPEGNRFISKSVSSVTFFAGESSGPVSYRVEKIIATAPPVTLPDWVGQRPPVDGDWKLTLREEFTSPTIDESIWNIYTANHWDKRSHFSKENVILSDGTIRLRFDKKEGFHNDDPSEYKTAYATGFLDTFGKWTQRYGYFETRLKLPTAPGLWPAFWMMPDRGPAAAPRWKREQTTNGGMEFDIMEFLSGWGPYRYNVAYHWDGYGKEHKHIGTSEIYFQHDKDGFITVGMLWLPGEVVYYCNGKPVGRWNSDRISSVHSILMFTHVSGGWDNSPIDDSKLPSDLEIDYVRAWQRDDLR